MSKNTRFVPVCRICKRPLSISDINPEWGFCAQITCRKTLPPQRLIEAQHIEMEVKDREPEAE